MSYDEAPEHVKLAVELIRQLENMKYPEEAVVEAALLIMQDTLNKMDQEERLVWRNRLSRIFELPPSLRASMPRAFSSYSLKKNMH